MCPFCSRYVNLTTDDPGVSATTLGPGTYHYACAKLAWAKQVQDEVTHKAQVFTARSESAKKRFAKVAPALAENRELRRLAKQALRASRFSHNSSSSPDGVEDSP